MTSELIDAQEWKIRQDGDALLICKNDHKWNEPCKWERYVPAHEDESYVPPADWSFATRRPASDTPAIPPNFVLVPVEPTEEMVEAGWIDAEDVSPRDIWRAMIEAAKKEGE